MNSDVPEFIRNAPRPSDDEYWRRLASRFDELRDLFEVMQIETAEDAIGEKNGGKWIDRRIGWADPHVGRAVPSWLMVHYNPSMPQDILGLAQQTGRDLIPYLERAIADRVLTPEFVRRWGQFCEQAGMLSLAYMAGPASLRELRINISKRRDAQRKWVALQLIELMDRGVDRRDAEIVVMQRIEHILAAGVFPEGFGREWFESLLLRGDKGNGAWPERNLFR